MDTLLRELIRQEHLKYKTFRAEYSKAAAEVALEAVAPIKAQFQRWLAGQLKGGTPYPDACRMLEHMFPPWTAAQLFEPYDPDRHLLPPNGDVATGVCWMLCRPASPQTRCAATGSPPTSFTTPALRSITPTSPASPTPGTGSRPRTTPSPAQRRPGGPVLQPHRSPDPQPAPNRALEEHQRHQVFRGGPLGRTPWRGRDGRPLHWLR